MTFMASSLLRGRSAVTFSGGDMSLGVVSGKGAIGPNPAFVLDEQARVRATLARVTIFRELPPATIDDLARRVTLRRVPGGDAIVSRDQVGDALYIVMAGRAKVVMTGESGREVTLAVLRAGDIFGEMS